MSRISHFSRILLLLTLALLPRLAQAQRIGPLGPTDRQQSKALSTERTAAVGPPSLQLSLPPPAVAALPPLGPDDLQLLQPQEGQPPVIGIHRPLPPGSVSLSFSGGTARTTAEGAWQAIPAGRLWRLRITSPSARAMRVHFRDFAIGAGKLWLYSADGQTVGPYTGSGLYGDGNFWSDIVFGDSLTIEYLPDPVVTEEAVPFQIVEISHIWGGAFGGGGEAGVQPPIAASGGARTGREAAKLLTDWINVVVGTQSMEQSPAADNPPDTKTARIAKQIQLVERSASLDHPFPKAATPLSPGKSTTFSVGPVDSSTSVGPVDSSTLFTGDHSFQLLVPENATSVTFTLESVDPGIDMDLFVRYGEDNDLQNGRVVSDYSSEGFTGNEEIVITPQSDPPLRAGTYFVSVALFETGVVAMATLTAEVERDDAPLPPISGGTLTPGQPSAFRLGPIDSPTLLTGDHSFRLEVPTGASRVIFTLESVDPDVDVGLFVRFGEDNRIQNGRPVSDHASQSLTGNARIGITRRSDPPLRAGTYFVSVLVYDTGVVAEGTLTAAVETDTMDCHLDVTCYPEWSSSAAGAAYFVYERSEGSFSCSGTLLNNTREDFTPYFLTASHCVDTEEEARSVMAFWHYQTQTCNGELPDFLSVPRTMGASLLSTLGGGSIEGRPHPDGDMTLLRLEGDLPDGVMFQGWDASPQPFGTQVTGIHHPGNRDWGFFKRLSFGQIIPNPYSTASADVYAIVSWAPGQGYTEGGSSGSALFSSPGTVVGADSFIYGGLAEVENACRTGSAFLSGYTHFSVFYPHIRQFIDIDSPLTPGQPATFRLEPVDTPTIFLGDSSFRLEVPENASRVTFTLESVDPDINVDLYVRYGEDNDIRDGRVIADYSSEGPTGNEEIIITRQSDPPLRAGTYFVSLEVRTTGVVAEGTVRAEFDTPLQTGGPTYYFPHLAVGASWQTTITYINYSREEVTCQTDFISDHGTPLMVSFAALGTVVSRTDVLPPGGSVHQETNVDLNASLAPGWARATCSGPVQASLLYRLHNSEGAPTAEAGVNATAVPATRFVTFAEQGEGQFGTGVAYANPSAISVPVTFTARDGVGEVLASVVRTLSPGGHDAHGMAELFGLTSFTGSIEVTSTEPIVSLSLNFEAAPVFSSLPPGELDASAQGSTTYYFPHLAVGASWQTTITYINYSREEVTCQTDFISDHGIPLMVSFAALGTVVSRTDVLPPGGSVHQETNVDLNASLAPGWARATCSGPVQASLLYRLHNSEGAPTAEAGVNATAVPATRFVTFAEQGEGQFGTGVAYANPSAISVPVTFTARDGVGEVLASVVRTLSPGGHDAHGMAELFGLTSFTGSIEVTSTEPIVSLSLNFEAAPVFSSLPPGETVIPPGMNAGGDPDLAVYSITAFTSPSGTPPGGSFSLAAGVRNVGDGAAAATTLRYYRSTDAAITSGDTAVGTDEVSALLPAGLTEESIRLTAPASAGTYYYGACVDVVSGESRTGNNCSPGRRIRVTAEPEPPALIWPRDGEFTDSQGRTMLYRLHFRDEWDPSEPRGLVVFFHGNNRGTQHDMVTGGAFFAEMASNLGLAFAAVGSPEGADHRPYEATGRFSVHFQNPSGSGRGIRYWVEEDARLVHELLQSGFNGSIAVDYNQIIFWGGSAGTGFLGVFLARYAGLYGGGFYAWCGRQWATDSHDHQRLPGPRMRANWAPSFPWTPSSTARVRERFRIFVQSTTEDHLYEFAAPTAHYYGEVLGLQTRADIDGPGGHCRPGTVPAAEVLKWLSSSEDRNPVQPDSNGDADGDGIPDALDDDDDSDGAWDVIDALPLDPRDWRDTDSDGIGDFEDRDADGDGVNNDQDAFSLDAREWSDGDGDGIGDNLDQDDDNDGLPDTADSQPLEGVGGDQLSYHEWSSARYSGLSRTFPSAFVHTGRPAMFVYPDSRGDRQSYQSINLGDGTFQIMIDRTERRTPCLAEFLPELCQDPPSPFAYYEHHVEEIHVDRNRNGDLTDDGDPLVLARNRGDQYHLPSASTILEVPYASGARLPYGIRFWTLEHLDDGLRYMGTSAWWGLVHPAVGEPVLVGTVDANFDGLFDSEGSSTAESVVRDFSDFACVDTNRNGGLEECAGYAGHVVPADSVSSGELFELDGRTFRLVVSPTGHKVEILHP